MKRLAFISALLGIGVAKAQRVPKCKYEEIVSVDERGAYYCKADTPPASKPANGECPVCGTMAEPHGPTTVTTWKNIANFGGPSIPAEETIRSPRFVACTHCRVLFQQEAEGDGSH